MATYQYVLIIVGFSGLSFALFYYCVYKPMEKNFVLLFVQVSPDRENNDDVAIDEPLSLLEDADEVIEIYDNGNRIKNSLYNNPEFIRSVQDKLEDNKNFRVLCFFNFDEGLDFTKAFAKEPRVEVLARKEGSLPDEIHYKIIDGGKRAYLSKHAGDHKRRYKAYDCSRLGRLGREKAYDLLFRNKLQDRANFYPIQEA